MHISRKHLNKTKTLFGICNKEMQHKVKISFSVLCDVMKVIVEFSLSALFHIFSAIYCTQVVTVLQILYCKQKINCHYTNLTIFKVYELGEEGNDRMIHD